MTQLTAQGPLVPRDLKMVHKPHPLVFYGPKVFVRTDYFCPHCGRQDMWQEKDGGEDFYVGIPTVCETCHEITLNLDTQQDDIAP